MKQKIANAMMWYAHLLRQEHKLAYLLTLWAGKLHPEVIDPALSVRGRYDR